MKKITVTNTPLSEVYTFKISDEKVASFIAANEVQKTWGEVGEYSVDIADITEEHNLELQRLNLIESGLKARSCCQTVLDFIAGYNISSQFTPSQVTELVTQFSDIVTLLQLNRPISAKPLIQAVQVSATVPQYIKDHILSIIESYGY